MDTERDTGYVIRATLQSPPGKTVLGAGSMLSWTDYLKVWCEVNKVPFGGYDEVPIQAFEKYMPVPDLGREMGEMFLFFDEFGYTGGEEGVVNAKDVSTRRGRSCEAALMIELQLGVPCPLTTWEEYIKAEGVWSDVL